MARFSIIENGIVVNQVEADTAYAAKQGWIPAGDSAIGDLWDGVKYSKPPVDEPAIHNAAIKQQITVLESTITDRRYREAILGTDGGWLANVDAQIAELRAQIK